MAETSKPGISMQTAFRLSDQQEYVWSRPGAQEHYQALCAVCLDGPLHPQSLLQAIRHSVKRHEILRTVFRHQPGMKVPFQVILDDLDPDSEMVDLMPMSRPSQMNVIETLVTQHVSFDFERGPLLRASLAALSPDLHYLILRLPALSSDLRGTRNLVSEIGRHYDAIVRGHAQLEDALQYGDIVEWQNQLLSDEDAKVGSEFWRNHCRTLAATTLPSFLSLPSTGEVRFETVARELDSTLLTKVDAMCRERSATPADVLLSCWQLLLDRLMGDQVTLACEFDGRNYDELENSLGLLAKYLPVQIRPEEETTFAQLLSQVQNKVADARAWQQSFTCAMARDLRVPVGYEYGDWGSGQVYGGVRFTLWRQQFTSEPFALKLSAWRQGERLRLEWQFDAAQLTRETVERWSSHFVTLLAGALENPGERVSRLPLLTAAERQELLFARNQTKAEYPSACIHELIAEQAARTPERIAVRCGDRQLSYRALNEQANQLAHYLRGFGVGPDVPVGLCLERSVETLLALLAILKAGGAYLPVSPSHPPARLAQQLRHTRVLITEQGLLPSLPDWSGTQICLERDRTQWQQEPPSDPAVTTSAENLVYLLHTSGSTGVPKAVAVRHRNLVNYAHFISRRLELERFPEGLQFATVSTLTADLGNTCIFPALLSGGCLHIIPGDTAMQPVELGRYFQTHGIDVLKIVPSHLRALLDSSAGAAVLPRRYLLLGGETFTASLLAQIEALGATCEIFNHYGPTETTVGSLTLRVASEAWPRTQVRSIPLGRPIANTRVYLLDAHQQPVPLGVAGELYIAGAGVTAGYYGQPQETAARFLPDPFAGGCMYRTGDRARAWPDGSIEFLGRLDEQLKIRGFRIEPGEIEAVLVQHPEVRQAAVLAAPDEAGELRLVAYVVPRAGADLAPPHLQAFLRQRLPDYLVPTAVVLLPKLPLTPNGKLHRAALPSPEQAHLRQLTYEPPRTPTEHTLSRIWGEVLRRPRVGRHDHFFDLGGHSLLATQVVSRIREHFQVALAIQILFDKPTISDLGELIDDMSNVENEEVELEIRPVERETYRLVK